MSSNLLSNTEHDAFLKLVSLHALNLSKNNLNDLALKLPETIEHLDISSNSLKYWPIVNVPGNLQTLELQNNFLIEIFNGAILSKSVIEFPNVTLINVSHNHVDSLPIILKYPMLKVLDLSFNNFAEVPQELERQAPNLDWLLMNGNPIKRIAFSRKIAARKIEFSQMPLLHEVDASQFDLVGT